MNNGIKKYGIFLSYLVVGMYLHAGTMPSGAGLFIVDPVTITAAGTYYLAYDIVGTITIAADNVVLDLNSKKISGSGGNGVSVTGHAAVTIKNGIIQGATAANAGGILISTCSLVEVSNIDFIGNTTGAYILTSTNVLIEACSFVDQRAVATPASSVFAGALVIDNSNNVIARDNQLTNNVNCFGILMHNHSHENILENNTCNQNQSGIYVHNGCFNNEIIGNTCSENSVTNKANSGTGIYLNSNCSKNTIQGNTCSGNSANSNNAGVPAGVSNGGTGIYLSSNCSKNIIQGNICIGNQIVVNISSSGSGFGSTTTGGSGVYLNSNCLQNTIQGNICSDNSVSARSTDLDGATANNSGSGIYLNSGCLQNIIEDNTCIGNSATSSSSGSGTATAYNGGTGIYLNITCLKNTLQGNICTSNLATTSAGGSGIFINNDCDDNAILENSCNDHILSGVDTGYGIRVQTSDCNNNGIFFNQCFKNTGTGISDAGGTTAIHNNSATKNTTGIVSAFGVTIYDNISDGNSFNYSLSAGLTLKIRVQTDSVNTGSWGDNFSGL